MLQSVVERPFYRAVPVTYTNWLPLRASASDRRSTGIVARCIMHSPPSGGAAPDSRVRRIRCPIARSHWRRSNGASNIDFALHHMGWGLADRISQGAAGDDQFRTAPLWGIAQRLFFLHDGRTSDLLQAIGAHSGRESEANRKFNSSMRSRQRRCRTSGTSFGRCEEFRIE